MDSEEPKEKQCTKCLAFKAFSEFHAKNSNRDGLKSICKKCIAAAGRAYRSANRDKMRESRKAYYNANKDKVSARCKAYRDANKDKISASSSVYRASNRADRNQCEVINALNPKKMESLQSKLESLSKTKTTKQQ